MDSLSRISKVDGYNPRDEVAWDKLVSFARTLEPALARAFIAAVRALGKNYDAAAVARFIAAQDVESATRAAMPEKALAQMLASLEQAFNTAAKAGAQHIAATEARTMKILFRQAGAEVQSILRQSSLDLIQQVTQTTRDGIAGFIEDGLFHGVNPRESARHLRQVIGLTDRQSRAVANFRRLLESASPEALTRALRDKRYDNTVRSAIEGDGTLSGAQIDEMVQAYFRRYLIYRSETIARTESIGALSAGQQALWQQAEADGKLRGRVMIRRWYTAKGERTCDFCREIPALNPDGVSLRDPFVTPKGLLMAPPGHPDCRCVVFTRPKIRAA